MSKTTLIFGCFVLLPHSIDSRGRVLLCKRTRCASCVAVKEKDLVGVCGVLDLKSIGTLIRSKIACDSSECCQQFLR